MSDKGQSSMSGNRKALIHENGKIYFTRSTERRFFFFLTLVMLLVGILSKSGLF